MAGYKTSRFGNPIPTVRCTGSGQPPKWLTAGKKGRCPDCFMELLLVERRLVLSDPPSNSTDLVVPGHHRKAVKV